MFREMLRKFYESRNVATCPRVGVRHRSGGRLPDYRWTGSHDATRPLDAGIIEPEYQHAKREDADLVLARQLDWSPPPREQQPHDRRRQQKAQSRSEKRRHADQAHFDGEPGGSPNQADERVERGDHTPMISITRVVESSLCW